LLKGLFSWLENAVAEEERANTLITKMMKHDTDHQTICDLPNSWENWATSKVDPLANNDFVARSV